MLPGCGSPLKRRVAEHRAVVEAEDDLADPVALTSSGSVRIFSKPSPATSSVTITRSRESEVTTSGMTMKGWPRYSRAIVRWFDASSS